MTTWSVQLQFDADTPDDAQAVVQTWQLSAGVSVLTIIGAQMTQGLPLVVGESGSLEEVAARIGAPVEKPAT